MPQLQSGQLTPGQDGAPKLYGVDKQQNNVPFQEKLMQLFKAHEFVSIKNIDDEPVYWQYLPDSSEQVDFSEDGLQKIISREQPEMWVIGPGETEVLVGASAYRALDVMYKNVSAKKTLKRFRDPASPMFDKEGQHMPKNFNFADAGAQDEFIKQAYLGKAIPSFSQSASVPAVPAASVPSSPVVPVQNAQPIDNDAPKPKTTEGAPLAPVAYAQPDAEEQPAPNAAKILAKKANEPVKA